MQKLRFHLITKSVSENKTLILQANQSFIGDGIEHEQLVYSLHERTQYDI